MLNRAFNWFIRLVFGVKLNDTTNAFNSYRTTTLAGLRVSRAAFQPHGRTAAEGDRARLLVDRHTGHLAQPSHRVAKVKIKEMGARYLFIVLYVWLEKYFSRGDFRKAAG